MLAAKADLNCGSAPDSAAIVWRECERNKEEEAIAHKLKPSRNCERAQQCNEHKQWTGVATAQQSNGRRECSRTRIERLPTFVDKLSQAPQPSDIRPARTLPVGLPRIGRPAGMLHSLGCTAVPPT
jgi:hypothetical protein